VRSHGAFGIEVRDAHTDAVLVDVGARHLFQFEYVRSREHDDVPAIIVKADAVKPDTWDDEADGPWQAPTEANPAAESRWSESFGGATDNKRNGPTSVGADVRFATATHVYGIPEHATSFSLKPTIVGGVVSADPYRLYNLDVFEYELNNNMALYGSVPFLIAHSATRTVGFLWLNPSETWIDVEKDGAAGGVDTHWYSESGTLEFYVLVGPTPRDVLAQYAFLTGATPLPPMFSIAYHQCKWNYKNEEEVLAVNAGFNEHEMPMDVIWLDIEHTDGKRYFTWNSHAFPDPQRMLRTIGDDRRYMVTIVDPHIKRDSNYAVHTAAEAAGVYVRDANGASYEGHCWPGSSSWVDYTDASGRRWWAERFKYDQYVGSSDRLFIWNDMNEPSVFSGPEVTMHKTALHKHDIEHREVHNIYGMLMHRATWEGLLLRDNNERRPFLLTRAFFAGSQRYGAVWTGDNKADWSHLQASTPMLLALGVAGISFAGADVGGFFGDAGVELLTRWYQTAAFQPFFREHGHLDTRRKEPFLFDEPHRSAMRDALRTRYALLPYWYTTFRQGVDSGLPVMRGMFVAFPRETALFDEEQQFMVGDALLVLPVTREKATTETVVLPASAPTTSRSCGTTAPRRRATTAARASRTTSATCRAACQFCNAAAPLSPSSDARVARRRRWPAIRTRSWWRSTAPAAPAASSTWTTARRTRTSVAARLSIVALWWCATRRRAPRCARSRSSSRARRSTPTPRGATPSSSASWSAACARRRSRALWRAPPTDDARRSSSTTTRARRTRASLCTDRKRQLRKIGRLIFN
jgi:alpha-glucosidase (family GH31 glycosyl hydrolase)